MSKNVSEVTLRTKGILPIQKLKLLVEAGIISGEEGYPIEENQFQPNSIDLRLGEIAYRVRSSFLPENESVKQKIDKASPILVIH
jgi:dCTP deaminase